MKKRSARFRILYTFCLFGLMAVTVASASDLKPKENAQKYRHYLITEDYSIGVNFLSPEDAEKRLATPLSNTFYAVEVAFFPRPGKPAKVNWREFTLRSPDENRSSMPMEAADVAGTIHRMAKKPKRNVTVFPTAGVSVVRGGGTYPGTGDPNDPNYSGRQSRTGVGTNVGVGVGIDNEEQPGARPEDRKVMERELSDYALGEGEFTEPVAGMVYFPIGRMKSDARKTLEYRDPAEPAAAEPLVIDLAPILGP